MNDIHKYFFHSNSYLQLRFFVVSGRDAPEDVRASVEVSVAEIAENHARTVAVIAM